MNKRKIKIIGAGSIGNHFANAGIKLGWNVSIFDVDKEALERTKNKIYPSRYGAWDKKIKLLEKNDNKKYDLIIVGTPPDKHLEVAYQELNSEPDALLIEKPLCTPDRENLKSFLKETKSSNTKIFCGYDHVLGKGSSELENVISQNDFGKPLFIDVEFREHWEGIFKAHEWLDGPQDSYLGFSQRGGGAIGEHSHGINYWQFLSYKLGFGKIEFVSSYLDIIKTEKVNYDRIAQLNVISEKGLHGRIIQDVITRPSKKFARVQFENGFVEWYCAQTHDLDEVHFSKKNGIVEVLKIPKSRPDDFILELKHIDFCLSKKIKSQKIDLSHGIETMAVIIASIESNINKKEEIVNYNF